MKRTSSTSKQIIVTLFLSVFLGQTFMGLYNPKQAEAADIDGLPQYLNTTYDQFLSRVPDDNGKGNYTPSFRFILYSPNGASSTLRVTRGGVEPHQTAPPRCENFTRDAANGWGLTASRLDVDNAASGLISANDPQEIGCVNTSYGFRLEGITNYGPSTGPNVRFPGYAGTVIRLTLDEAPRGDSTFTDIETIGGSDRLSYIGNQTAPGGQPPRSADGVSMSLPQDSGNTISVPFAPPCNYNGGTKYVWWKDADSGDATNGGNDVNVEVRQYLNGLNGGYSVVAGPVDGKFGPGHESLGFTPIVGAKYRLFFSPVRARNPGVWTANTIKAWVPFDSAAAYVECPDNSVGDTACLRYREFNTDNGNRYRVSIFTGQNVLAGATYNSGGNTYVTRGGGLTPGDERTERQEINWGTGGLPNPSQGISAFDGNGSDRDILYANNLNQWHTVVSEEWEHLNNGNWKYIRAQVYNRYPCDLVCNMTVTPKVAGASLPNAVKANEEYTVNLSLTNRGPDPMPGRHPNGYRLIANGDYGQYYTPGGGFSLGVGQTINIGTFNLGAPGGPPRSFNLGNMYPDYYGLSGVGPLCSTSVNVYERFTVTPNASFASGQDFENPENIRWNTGGTNSGPAINSPYTSTMFRYVRNPITGAFSYPGYDIQAVSGSASFGNQTFPTSSTSYEFNDPVAGRGYRATGGQNGTWQPGDQLCSKIYINNGRGWAGPGDMVVEGPVETQSCPSITNMPYISAYGGDVAAGGGGLGLPCSSSGSIGAYFKSAGSGAQYAAYAMESISGFKSAFLRDASYPTAPRSPNDLTFGNTPSLGQYKLVDCATDFYNVDQFEDGDSRKNTAIPGSISAAGLPDGGQSVRTGNLTLNGGGFTGKHSIFVDGDVFITGNIAYTSTSWANIAEIPYFNLVVRGNIYISQDVTQLDGRYIAQPRSATEGGHIYTCAYAGGANAGQPVPTNPGSELWNQCGGGTNSRRLVINGQFVARTVHFLRTINTLSDGVGRETAANSRAGEVFNLSPEIFLGQPATRPKSTSTSGEYQNITVLPPIL